MLDRLETELIEHILHVADQDWFSSPRNKPRGPRPTKSCSLVCRRLRQVAQPMLWRVITLDNKGGLKVVKREVEAGELGRHIRLLEADGLWVEATEVGALVQSLPHLAEVSLRNFDAHQKNAADELLPHLQNLNRLGMTSVEFSDIRIPFPFNNLSSLFLSDVKTRESFLSKLLQPQYLPELRSLAFDRPCRNFDGYTFVPSPSNALLYQLDILQPSLTTLYLATSEVIKTPTTLFSGTIWHLNNYLFGTDSSPLVKNLHIRAYGLDEECLRSNSTTLQYVRDVLGKLVAFLPSSNIATLLLPLRLQQPTLAAERDEILAACRVKGVEVLWEDDTGKQRLFSEAFRRWVVKKKRAEAEKMRWTV